jgi:hypothetical protein
MVETWAGMLILAANSSKYPQWLSICEVGVPLGWWVMNCSRLHPIVTAPRSPIAQTLRGRFWSEEGSHSGTGHWRALNVFVHKSLPVILDEDSDTVFARRATLRDQRRLRCLVAPI